jgi:hypothetical protein
VPQFAAAAAAGAALAEHCLAVIAMKNAPPEVEDWTQHSWMGSGGQLE